jgi:4,5-dihydroxyphthalate decarboxylase
MAALSLSISFWNYDRTIPLLDGRVSIDGVDPTYTILSPLENFPRTFTSFPFDVTEMSFSNYMTAFAADDSPYIAIPVFPSRTFRHGSLFIHTDRGIEEPSDLEEKTIGLIEYDMTAAVVVRGMLRDEYDVDTSKIRWRVGDTERPFREEIPLPALPEGVDAARLPKGKLLNEMLATGELDAMIALEPPSCFLAGDPRIRRLFPDWRDIERRYYAKTGIFPIMHTIGIRRDLVAEHPRLPKALYEAFQQAKRIAMAELAVMNAPKVSLPWIAAELAATEATMGADFWPYGFAANRPVLEQIARYSHEDGLTPRPIPVDELFENTTHDL